MGGMEIQIAVAKTNKYAVTESGDTLEVVERPNGGLSVVLADGQTSGRGAKAVSMMVVRKVIGLLAEGVRDGAAARAASDLLYTEKKGKVTSTLNIVSVDLHTGTVVISRNNPAPFFIARGEEIDCIGSESKVNRDSAEYPPGHQRDPGRTRTGDRHIHGWINQCRGPKRAPNGCLHVAAGPARGTRAFASGDCRYTPGRSSEPG